MIIIYSIYDHIMMYVYIQHVHEYMYVYVYIYIYYDIILYYIITYVYL